MSAETTIRSEGMLDRVDRRKLVGPAVIGGAVVLLLIVGGILEPDFLSYDNLLAVMRAASIVGIAAVGMTFITLTGNFVSLSTEQTAIISGILFALALSNGWPVALAALVTFARGGGHRARAGRDRGPRHEPDRDDARRRRRHLRPRERPHGQPHRPDAHRRRRLDRHRAARSASPRRSSPSWR